MEPVSKFSVPNLLLLLAISSLSLVGVFVLSSIAPYVFPTHYIYLILALILFFICTRIDFEIFIAFSPHLYLLSILLLVITLVIGQVTRGAVRWIPLGFLTIQPSEVVRAFLLLYFARYLAERDLNTKRLFTLFFLILIPFILILIQPSLGVAILTGIGFVGILLSSIIEKKYFLMGLGFAAVVIPLVWFMLAPYQKQRVTGFINPEVDPLGSGYNSIQSMISIGSGRFFGRGLGEGVQTQLAFLPEKHTDFIFAAIAEELGLLGAGLVLLLLFVFFITLIHFVGNAKDPAARAFTCGVFLILLAQTIIHVGMNMKLFPITGVPLPFVSAGGSALLGTVIAVSMVMRTKKDD